MASSDQYKRKREDGGMNEESDDLFGSLNYYLYIRPLHRFGGYISKFMMPRTIHIACPGYNHPGFNYSIYLY